MFVVVGQRVNTSPVEGGRQRVLPCSRCGDRRVHTEHRVSRAATLFWVPVANVSAQIVWACEGCGSLLAEGEASWLGDQQGTAVGHLITAAAGLRDSAAPALERAKGALEEVRRGLVEEASTPSAPVEDAVELPPRKRRL